MTRVWTNGDDWVVAASAEEAQAILMKATACSEDDAGDLEPLADDYMLTIGFPECDPPGWVGDEPEAVFCPRDDLLHQRVVAPARVWARRENGYLGGVDY